MKPQNTPQFNEKTGVITLPAVEGVTWLVGDDTRNSGTVKALEPGESVKVQAQMADGVYTRSETQWTFKRPEKK